MPALVQPAMQNLQNIKRALTDPDTAAHLLHLLARKTSKVGKKKSKKIKGGAIAGIVIAIIVVVVVALVILFLMRRRARKRQMQVTGAPARV